MVDYLDVGVRQMIAYSLAGRMCLVELFESLARRPAHKSGFVQA